MVYRFLFYFANLIIRIYYRKFYINGLDKIPKDKPLLIVSNHPNGFLEPIIMACLFPIDLHFLVRGDLFENRMLRWLLLSTNQVPIYRFKDGIAALRNNQKTIEKTIEVLKRNKAIIIFAEGSTDARWYVREMKKGMARMAFQCLDGSPDLDLHILPIGVTFQNSSHPGTDVILNAGEAFAVKPFYSKNVKEAKDKMDELTEITRAKIQELTIHLEDKKNEKIIGRFWKRYILANATSFFPRVLNDTALFKVLKAKEKQLNEGLLDTLELSSYSNNTFILYLPLALVGFVVWTIPIGLAFLITNKFVKQLEFKSSVRAALGGFMSMIYICMIIIILTIKYNLLTAFIGLIFIFGSGIFTLYVWENIKLQNKEE